MTTKTVLIAEYRPENPVWPPVLRLRLTTGVLPSGRTGYGWTARDCNDNEDTRITSDALAPKQGYETIAAAVSGIIREGWRVAI